MIRNVVTGRLRDGVDPAEAENAMRALAALRVDGVEFEVRWGLDRGLREGNAHYGFTVDFVDADAYRRYDADEEHNRIRRELFSPISASVERFQFELHDC